MNDTTGRKTQHTAYTWEDFISENHNVEQWQQSAFHAAVEKLQAGHGNPDTVMRMGEAFGRGLFAQHIKDKTSTWTIKEWIAEIQKEVYKPLGTEFTFTKVSPDVAMTFMNRNPLAQSSHEQAAASLFSFGVLRGLFRSAFPKGELVLNDKGNDDQPEIFFKTHASSKDKLERERTIRTLTFSKKEEGT